MIDRRFIDFSLIVQGVADEPSDDYVKGTQYIVGEMPLGDFENAEPGQIARYDGEKWNFISPKEAGLEVINAETGELLQFDGVIWNVVATLSGGSGGSSDILIIDGIAEDTTASTGVYTLKWDYSDTDGIIHGGAKKGMKFLWKYNYTLLEVLDDNGNVMPDNADAYDLVEGQMIGTKIPENTIIFNKQDISLYKLISYIDDRDNQQFILKKFSQSRTFYVDEIVDWIGEEADWDENIVPPEGYKRLFTSSSEYYEEGYISIYDNDEWFIKNHNLPEKTYIALTSRSMIDFPYSSFAEAKADINYVGRLGYRGGYERLTKLSEEDIFINKSDGAIYKYSGSTLEKIVEGKKTVPTSITAFISRGDNLPETANIGDKFYNINERKIYTATSENTWDEGTESTSEDVFILPSDFKVYKSDTIFSNILLPSTLTIPKGYMFLNEADGNMYYFNGSEILDRRFLDTKLTVKGFASSVPSNPAYGDQWIVSAVWSGYSESKVNSIAKFDGSWKFVNPVAKNSLEVFNSATKELLNFNGTSWIVVANFNFSTELNNTVGDLSGLTTSNKSSVVAAINEVATVAKEASSGSSVVFVDYIGKSSTSDPGYGNTATGNVEGDKYWKEGSAYPYLMWTYTSGKWQYKQVTSEKFLSKTSFKIFYYDGSVKSINVTADTLIICKEDNKAYYFNGSEIKGVVSN